MKTKVPSPFVVDVHVDDANDGLILATRRNYPVHALRGALRPLLPRGVVRSQPDGVWISGAAVHAFDPDRLTPRVDCRLTADAKRFCTNRARASRVHEQLRAELAHIRLGGVGAEQLRTGRRQDVLDPHQLANVAAMTLRDGFGLCLFDEQGAGKTVSLIFAFDVLVERNEVDSLLIVAPKSMVPEWPRDFERFMGDLYRIEVLSGTKREKLAALRRPADVVITNFETAVALEHELRAYLRQRADRAIITIDESFFIKNLDAKRTRALKRLREWCGRAFVLCGTPAPNSAHDLVQQFTLVDFGLTFAGVVVPDDRVAAVDVVQRAIDARGLFVRHLKKDVLPALRSKLFHRLFVRMQPEQARLYGGAVRNLLLDLSATDDTTFKKRLRSFFARRSALLQICSHPLGVVADYREVPAKLLALDEILEELIADRGEKVIVWSYYIVSIEQIVRRYARFSPVRYDGSVETVDERRESVRRFQEDSSTMLFVGNPAAAGAGLTLHRAKYAVYESLSNQAAHYLQSLDRIHRRGQERDVEYLVLLCEGSIETAEYQRLRDKEQRAQRLLGDVVEPPHTRESMLAEMQAFERLVAVQPAG